MSLQLKEGQKVIFKVHIIESRFYIYRIIRKEKFFGLITYTEEGYVPSNNVFRDHVQQDIDHVMQCEFIFSSSTAEKAEEKIKEGINRWKTSRLVNPKKRKAVIKVEYTE